MKPDIQIQLATSSSDLNACFDLRRRVFIVEQKVSEELEVDGEDGKYLHVIAKLDNKPVGTARFKYTDDVIKVQRVCVHAKHRGKSIGARLMDFITSHGKIAKRARFVRLSSQKDAVPFYESIGFMAEGDEYIEAGIPHLDMELKL